ncbi:MerR family DNA-binding transcriptional regulator [Arthrobacter sp. JCM 19049]|uniref:MerR family DNA-binding transcriptional regulator n=1 Tax=Arthrobacter sp. JCM 19049 TaxID=1460643 RepID=UPI000ACE2E19|nr:MerR family DNA-binding transcriptional regulator [Arthrobacter sp. JCM 19049]
MSHSSRQEATAADELLTIGQVSERTGVARSALHYYEQLGLVVPCAPPGTNGAIPGT